ncbi:nucleoside triphosphate pyrophosphohydrolase [Streptomyces sp. WMMB 322]|uniref:nucleoside triphosphate pyrophosphohydrolase n=1 Tax=Streptomyces sp. WMMB 322 TaxID=1286821 RepID=UPI000823E439|nr:nucleoside triphosphate pyrophosphohydrolase [Streptomyces sp. WMMB 322]SCK10627.1 XTP/dITP diphosphohydrolase [Streptomyces sp. WMMB 322]
MNASASAGSPAGRIVLLTTSHRVAPGLLSWPAWEALRTADRVLCQDPGHPQLPYVREAGIHVATGALPGARELVESSAEGRTTVVIAAAEGEPQLTDGLAALAGSGRATMPELELLPGSYDLPGARLLDLVQVMDSIRAACPWSGARTHEGLVKYGIEEMYELVEAIEEGDRGALCEELGDVLLQVVFHARIAQEDPQEPFSIDDVAAGIVEKLIHRHPHVFGEEQAATAEDVREHWLRTKAAEKRRDSVTEGIPLGQPALALAAKLAQRVRLAGLDVPAVTAPGAGGIGYELLALAVRAEAEGVDPETALRVAARTYRDGIRAAEGLDAQDASPDGHGEGLDAEDASPDGHGEGLDAQDASTGTD